jgi:dynein light chain roadblock-type
VKLTTERANAIVRDLDPSNELTYLRLRSRKHEVLIAPEKEFILIVVQNPMDPSRQDNI